MTYLKRLKLLTLVITTAFLLAMSVVPAGAIPAPKPFSVSFDVAGPIVVGETFTLDVYVNHVGEEFANDAIGFGFNLDAAVNGANWILSGFTVAAPFDDVSGSVNPGMPEVAGSYFSLSPLTGDFLLASLDLTAITVGTYDFCIMSDYIFNFNEGLIYSFLSEDYSDDLTHQQSFTVSSAPIPEPATILLLSSGLIGIFGLNKRKKEQMCC